MEYESQVYYYEFESTQDEIFNINIFLSLFTF